MQENDKQKLFKKIKDVLKELKNISIDDKIELINEIRKLIHEVSPFKNEPVDYIKWVKNVDVFSNDYNPNTVAPPEMELLEHSIKEDGYTQPIVTWINDGLYEVVDGFHRNRIGKENKDIQKRIHNYLPLTIINQDRISRGDRIAATIRHNRARGKHSIDGMAEIVIELKRRNWSDKKISKELGMDADEVLRLCQITGLAEMFANGEFSEAWEIDSISEEYESINEENIDLISNKKVDVLIKNKNISQEEIPNDWENRTERKSVLKNNSRLFAQVKQNASDDNWTWYTYQIPMQTGKEKTKEEAICKAMKTISESE